MRFVEWNCCGGWASDYPKVVDLNPDIAVLCEVPRGAPAPSLIDPPVDWHWTGAIENKGLALASFGPSFESYVALDGCGTHTAAATTSAGIGVLGIWTAPPSGPYAPMAMASVSAYSDWLRTTPSIVAGDFNLGYNGSEAKGFRQILDALDDLGYVSAYHHVTGEAWGGESRHTYFHQWKQDRPFHIDYCFLHRDLVPLIRHLETGGFDPWVAKTTGGYGASDHVPMILDLDL